MSAFSSTGMPGEGVIPGCFHKTIRRRGCRMTNFRNPLVQEESQRSSDERPPQAVFGAALSKKGCTFSAAKVLQSQKAGERLAGLGSACESLGNRYFFPTMASAAHRCRFQGTGPEDHHDASAVRPARGPGSCFSVAGESHFQEVIPLAVLIHGTLFAAESSEVLWRNDPGKKAPHLVALRLVTTIYSVFHFTPDHSIVKRNAPCISNASQPWGLSRLRTKPR